MYMQTWFMCQTKHTMLIFMTSKLTVMEIVNIFCVFSKPNIPGYTGCTLYQGHYAPAHSKPHPPNSQATTKLVHK